MADQKTRSFKLLPYETIAKAWMTPAILILILGLVVLFAGSFFMLESNESIPVGIGLTILGIVVVIYCQLAKRAHITCHKNRLVIHTPLHPIAISYQRIRVARNTEFKRVFPVDTLKQRHVRRYQNLFALTVPVIEVKGLPYPRWYMKLWLHRFVMVPNMSALAFPVEDWMGFSRALDVERTEWQRQRRQKRDEYYDA